MPKYKQLEKNFQDIPDEPEERKYMDIGETKEPYMYDPGESAALRAAGGGEWEGKEQPQFGKFKITKTRMDGESGRHTGASFNESLPSMKERMPTANDDAGKGENGFEVNRNIKVLTFGDPNNSADDAKDTIGDNDPFSNYKGSYGFEGEHKEDGGRY